MKNNRKNRKLQFIRKKNALRLGKEKFKWLFYISNCLEINEENLINKTKEYLYNEFRISLINAKIKIGKTSQDLINETKSVIVQLYN